MLPIEILEIIFKHSDGNDIMNFRLVCSTWYSIVVRLSKDTDLWETKCKKEIPSYVRNAITNKLYPSTQLDYRDSKDPARWSSLYQSWNAWRNIKETTISTQTFTPIFIRLPTVQVTCVNTSENLIAVGSSEGFIAFYDIENPVIEPMFIADQVSSVSNVQFLRCGELAMALSVSTTNHIMVWDIVLRTSCEEKQYGNLISTIHGCICIANKQLLKVLSRYNRNAYQFPPCYGTIVALVTDGNQVSVLTDLGFFVRVNLEDPNVVAVEKYVKPPAEKVCKYYFFEPWIAVCITTNGFLGISVDSGNWMMFEILSKLHGVPTCVLFHANILVLGLDSGSVHMYYIPNFESLDDGDFQSENSKAIVVDNQAIVALDIMERPYKQYLIAATAEKVSITEIKYFA